MKTNKNTHKCYNYKVCIFGITSINIPTTNSLTHVLLFVNSVTMPTESVPVSVEMPPPF